MRKISDLEGDEFFDVLYALTLILPVLSQLEIVKSGFGVILKPNPDSKLKTKEQKDAALTAEIFTILANELPVIIPHLTSKQNRNAIYEVINILDDVPVSDIKKYPAAKLTTRIKQIFSDSNFKDFLSYAEPSDTKK